MSRSAPSANEIAPDALWAIEALEKAREPAELGPAFAVAEREKRRLGAFWRLEFVFTVLFGLGIALTFAIPRDAAPILELIGIGLLLALVVVRFIVSRNSPRVAALARVNDAIDRWRSLVPAMRELPR